MSNPRALIVLQYFPSEVNGIVRLTPTTEDVQDTRDKITAQLNEAAMRYTQSGWIANVDGITYSIIPSGKGMVGSLELTLEDE